MKRTSLLIILAAGCAFAQKNWSAYAGGANAAQYSSLNQIDKTNVSKLEQAWFFPAPSQGGRFGFNPLVVDGVMYVMGADNAVVALDAATGKMVWIRGNEAGITNRGITYWENKPRSDQRILYASNSYLIAINAKTGVGIPSFGKDGRVNLREGLGRDPQNIAGIQSSTPGQIFDDLIIMGSATGEEYGSPPGDLRAYNVVTGKLIWTFHTVPHPGEFGYETWPPDAWKYIGGVNTWGEMAVDEKRGIVYLPTGSPTYDFYGADRKGDNLFSDCLIALDARTGKRLWHFQFVHHDLWDFDAVMAPKLLTIKQNGKPVDIVAQATKQGYLYVFDRVTGKPIWPVEERKVPGSDMPGENASPTQPIPTKPPAFARQAFTVDDINPYTDKEDQDRLRALIGEARNEGLFTPPGRRNTMQIPGNNGGGNWGGGAADAANGFLYIMSKDAPTMLKLEAQRPARGGVGSSAQQGRALYEQRCQTCHGPDRLGHAGVAPQIADAGERLGGEQIRNIVRNGRGEMPKFATLARQEIDNLVAYFADPKGGEAPVPAGPGRGGPGGGQRGAAVAAETPGTKYWTGYGTLNTANGLPAIGPPWSNITAYDLNEGTVRWKIPIGVVPELAAKGIKDTGSYWPRGGPVVTAGGLVFAGTGADLTAHAYDAASGKILWEKELPSGPEGIPAVYEVNGRQFVVFCTRSGRVNDNLGPNPNSIAQKIGAPEAQGYYAFALPAAK
jgi:quinoprotein glucose dehydrogenase